MADDQAAQPPRSATDAQGAQRRHVSPAARRALAEAEARRAAAEAEAREHLREVGGREGLDPTRYGDWEKDGLAKDF